MNNLTHINERGEANMVDVGQKEITSRTAVAEGRIFVAAQTLKLIEAGDAKKGDVIATARLAGIMAAKKTSELIPLCHQLLITKVGIDISTEPNTNSVHVVATAKVAGQTGVEMEALTAVSVTCLTIYDMVKAVDKEMRISDIRLLEKSGGQSGHYKAS